MKKTGSSALFFSVAMFAALPQVMAQSYPAKPVRVIVPFVAGGAADIVTRVVSQKLGEIWNQQMIVDNRPGAEGIIGTEIGGEPVSKEPCARTPVVADNRPAAARQILHRRAVRSIDSPPDNRIRGLAVDAQAGVSRALPDRC